MKPACLHEALGAIEECFSGQGPAGSDRDHSGGATVFVNADVESGRTAPTDTDLDGLVCLLAEIRLNQWRGRQEAPVNMSGFLPFFSSN